MMDFTAFNVVDYAVVIVLVISAIFSTLRGMTREFLGLLGWVLSFLVAHYTRPFLEDPISNVINADRLSSALAWGLPFVGTVIIWFLLASLLSAGLTRAGLGILDRGLGVIFGLARGYLLVLFAFVGAVYVIEGENKLPATVKNAQSTPIFSHTTKYLAGFMPEDLSEKLSSNLIDHTNDYSTAAEKIEKMIGNGAEIMKKPLELLTDEKSY